MRYFNTFLLAVLLGVSSSPAAAKRGPIECTDPPIRVVCWSGGRTIMEQCFYKVEFKNNGFLKVHTGPGKSVTTNGSCYVFIDKAKM